MENSRQRKKTNREIALKTNNGILAKYGSIDRKHPEVVYLSGKCWIKCDNISEKYAVAIKKVKKDFDKIVNKFVYDKRDIFGTKHIFDIDYSSFFNPNKKVKFLSFDLFVRQKNKELMMLNNDVFKSVFIDLIDELSYDLECNGFMPSKRK